MKFAVYGTVRGQARPRFTKRGHTYQLKADRDYKELIKQSFIEANQNPPLKSPVWLYIDVFRELPSSRPKKINDEPDIYKPDGDNIGKIVLDALNGLAYEDDKQVTMLMVRKHRRMRGQQERIEVRIEESDD